MLLIFFFFSLAMLSCLFYKVKPRIILFGYTLSSCRGLDWNCVDSVISLGAIGTLLLPIQLCGLSLHLLLSLQPAALTCLFAE